ncbi:MAG TPA: NUDIX hydrolase [Acidobacteriota bacterium]|nr:NUDIX hydrolase [Acidobacteriota bacterium]
MAATELESFLKAHSNFVEEYLQWGLLQFSVRGFLCCSKPPVQYVTSAKGIVMKQGLILVLRDPESTHILPGGRCEPNETWEETFRREIAEETGWRLRDVALLGVRYFHHLTAKPDNYKYPYPDFCQVIFKTEANEYDSSLLDPSRYELECFFRTPTEVQNLALTQCEKHFLNAVLYDSRA